MKIDAQRPEEMPAHLVPADGGRISLLRCREGGFKHPRHGLGLFRVEMPRLQGGSCISGHTQCVSIAERPARRLGEIGRGELLVVQWSAGRRSGIFLRILERVLRIFEREARLPCRAFPGDLLVQPRHVIEAIGHQRLAPVASQVRADLQGGDQRLGFGFGRTRVPEGMRVSMEATLR